MAIPARRAKAASRVFASLHLARQAAEAARPGLADAFQLGAHLAAADGREADRDPFLSHRGDLLSLRSACGPSRPRSPAAVRRRRAGKCPWRRPWPARRVMSQPRTAPGMARIWPPMRCARSQTCQPSMAQGRVQDLAGSPGSALRRPGSSRRPHRRPSRRGRVRRFFPPRAPDPWRHRRSGTSRRSARGREARRWPRG